MLLWVMMLFIQPIIQENAATTHLVRTEVTLVLKYDCD